MHLRTHASSNQFQGLVFVILLAIAYIGWLFPIGFIAGTNHYWLAQNEDIAQYISGFWVYFTEPWHWPLWKIESINWPTGTLTTFVDAIPLYSAILKASITKTEEFFNPFGYWVAICLILQAIGAWWILKVAKISSWICLFCLTALLLTFPAWLGRIGHISLLSHWLILFAYALIIQGWQRLALPYLGWSLLLGLAFFINIYLCAMVCWLCASQMFAGAISGYFKQLCCWALIFIFAMALLIYLTMWPLPASTGAIEYGFGVYSLNLLSPFSGGIFLNKLSGAATPGQAFEGFNYLGFGTLALCCIAIYIQVSEKFNSRVPDLKNEATQYKTLLSSRGKTFLVLALLCATLYALSNQIYWGPHFIYGWSVPSWAIGLTGQLRASGRFFWLVGYGLVIYSVITISRHYSSRMSQLILMSALCIQVVDIWPYLSTLRTLGEQAHPEIINLAKWEKMIPKEIDTIYFFPKMKCAQRIPPINTLLPIQEFAAFTQRKINTAYVARYNPQCHQESLEVRDSLPKSSIYIFVREEYKLNQIADFFPQTWQIQCTTQDFGYLCADKKIIDLSKTTPAN